MRYFRKIFFVLGLTALTFSPILAQAVGSIGFAALVKGDVKAISLNGVETQLKSKDEVFEGQRIITLAQSKVQLIFKDESIFTLGQNAEIKLDKFVYDPATHEGNSLIEATKGLFKFLTGKIAKKNPQHVKINTPFATIGVRGSGGLVDLQPSGEMLMSVTECCLDLTSRGSGETVPLNQVGTFSRVLNPNHAPSAPQQTPADIKVLFDVEVGAFDRAAQKEVAALPEGKIVKRLVKKAPLPVLEQPLLGEALEEQVLEGEVLEIKDEPVLLEPLTETVIDMDIKLDAISQDKTTDPDVVVQTVRRGFAGGIMRDSSSQNFVMTNGGLLGAVSMRETDARIALENVNPLGDGEKVSAIFKNTGLASTGYIMEQDITTVETNTDGLANVIDFGAGLNQLTSSELLSQDVCSTCAFIDWGVWDTTIIYDNAGGPIEVVGTTAPIHYVVGEVTQNLGSLGLTGTATLEGGMAGSISVDGSPAALQADSGVDVFTAVVNLGTQDLTNFDASFGGYDFVQGSPVPIASTLDATFSSTLDVTNADSGVMNINGALFGPTAQDIGGNFDMDIINSGLNIQGAGIFAGVTTFVSP